MPGPSNRAIQRSSFCHLGLWRTFKIRCLKTRRRNLCPLFLTLPHPQDHLAFLMFSHFPLVTTDCAGFPSDQSWGTLSFENKHPRLWQGPHQVGMFGSSPVGWPETGITHGKKGLITGGSGPTTNNHQGIFQSHSFDLPSLP